jgi:multiple sugar transport system permease protein
MGKNPLRTAIFYLVNLLLCLFFVLPIMMMFTAALQADEQQIVSDMGTINAFVPRSISLQNFADVFLRVDFGRLFFNSLFIVASIIVLGIIVNSMLAYALARIKFKGAQLILTIVILLIIIPFETQAVPLLLMSSRIHTLIPWLDSYQVQIIPLVANAFSIFLFYQFFIGISKDLEEAAAIDGANRWLMYTRVVIPLSRPVFATVAILQFLAQWGSLLWPVMVTRGPEFRPLPLGMQTLYGQPPFFWGDRFAFAAMMTIPTLFIFLAFQRVFIQSVASTGVKG